MVGLHRYWCSLRNLNIPRHPASDDPNVHHIGVIREACPTCRNTMLGCRDLAIHSLPLGLAVIQEDQNRLCESVSLSMLHSQAVFRVHYQVIHLASDLRRSALGWNSRLDQRAS